MSDLGDLLELLHGAHTRLSMLSIDLCDWHRHRPTTALLLQRGERGTADQLQWRQSGPWPTSTKSLRRIWYRRPRRVRVEIARGRELVRLGVRVEDDWWRWDRYEGASRGSSASQESSVNEVPPMLAPPLLEPAVLIPRLCFEPGDIGERAGREVMCTRAVPRDESSSCESPAAYELEFDLEHGTMLRFVRFEGATCVQISEVRAVRYNENIALDRFIFDPPE